MDNIFGNSDVHIQSWYAACRSYEIQDKPLSIELCGKKLCLFRDRSGQIIVLRDQCAHLGARLSKGVVISDNIQCPFHHWKFDEKGICTKAPGQKEPPKRRVESYPVTEKWGIVWIWNGSKPLFELPSISGKSRYLRMAPQVIRCHPHIMIVNGLDVGHFSTLHKIKITRATIEQVDRFKVKSSWEGQAFSRVVRFLIGSKRLNIQASFTTIGGNLALVEITSPVKFQILFSGKTTSEGFCESQTIVFFPTRAVSDAVRIMFLIYYLLHQDREILDDIEFRPDYIDRDLGYKLFTHIVNQMEVW